MGGAESYGGSRREPCMEEAARNHMYHVHRMDYRPALLYGSHAMLDASVPLVVRRAWGIGS